jgi:hypothetical protein
MDDEEAEESRGDEPKKEMIVKASRGENCVAEIEDEKLVQLPGYLNFVHLGHSSGLVGHED